MADDDQRRDDRWATQALKEIALEGLKEQRRARRWGIFFKLAMLAYLILLVMLTPSCQGGAGRTAASGRHTAVVAIEGVIADGGESSAERIIEGLEDAFAAKGVAGVILKINSPGGSPVQSGRVNDAIRRLREKHPDTPIYAVAGDMCASGAYYIAVATQSIYVDKASVVGSIGVLMDSFGFTEAMQKLGVERRLYTAGESKGFLDPFSPEQEPDVTHMRALLKEVHEQFITVVREGRGERLNETEPLFTGLVWSGDRSIQLGLADGLGDAHTVAREIIGAEELVDYTPRRDFMSAFAERLGASAARQLSLQLRGGALR